jgi:L-alanine-DL-glutamate epimerase-like enolase superfamily enzyme
MDRSGSSQMPLRCHSGGNPCHVCDKAVWRVRMGPGATPYVVGALVEQDMKIVNVESFAIQAAQVDSKPYWGSRAWGRETGAGAREISVEYPAPQRRRYVYSATIDTVLVRIVTDGGLVGYGEAKAPVAPQVTQQIIELLLKPLLLGQDPADTTVLWERMYAGMRVRGHRSGFYLEAISGVDIALWDILGQSYRQPIAKLLGGTFRDSVRVYASGMPTLPREASEEELEQFVAEAESLRQAGYTGIKLAMGRGLDGDLRCANALRRHFGSDLLLYADAAGVYDFAQAEMLGRKLEELNFSFFEMPIAPEDLEGYARLAAALTIPIALDSLSSRYDALEYLRRGGLDIVQPDACRAGGITECRRIAELADSFGAAFQPHVSIGSMIHIAASLHLAAAMPNTLVSEYWIGKNPLGNVLIEEPLDVERGYLKVPMQAGLGIRFRDGALAPFGITSL